MKVNKTSNYTGFKRDAPEGYIRANDTDVSNLVLLSQGRIRFGSGSDGVPGENLAGEFQVFTSSATANAEETIAHTIASVPIGYIILNQDKAASLYDSGTTWTSSNIYLKSSVATTKFTIFLLR